MTLTIDSELLQYPVNLLMETLTPAGPRKQVVRADQGIEIPD